MSGKSGKRDDSYFAADRRRKKKYTMIIIPIVIAVAAAGAAGTILYRPPQAVAISGIECNSTEFFTHHVHAHVDVFVNGQQQQIPANIGILSSPRCFYWLHTHDTDGIIHIEAPQVRQFTLGQFLDIWSQTGSNGQSFFSSVSAMPVKVYVDDIAFQGNYRDVELDSRKQIVLVYGNPPITIPTYDFGSLK